MVRVFVIPVITQLIQNIGSDQQATCQAYCQTEKVDERNKPVLKQISNGDFKIIANHGKSPPTRNSAGNFLCNQENEQLICS
jgi:hypothetical protein